MTAAEVIGFIELSEMTFKFITRLLLILSSVFLISLFFAPTAFTDTLNDSPLSSIVYLLTLTGVTLAALLSILRYESLLYYWRILQKYLPGVWALIMAAGLLNFGYALTGRIDILWLLIFYAWTVAAVLLLIASLPVKTIDIHPADSTKALYTAFFSMGLALLHNLFLLWAYDIRTHGDSYHYIFVGSTFFKRPSEIYGATETAYNSLPYRFLTALANGKEHPPFIVEMQILLSVAAIGFLVYVLCKSDFWLGLISGVLLALDTTWIANNLQILTESMATSLLVLSLAMLLHHYQHRHQLTAADFMKAGILYTFTAIVRPSNVLLLIPLFLFYFYFVPQRRRILWLFATMVNVLFLTTLYNGWQYDNYNFMGGVAVRPMFYPLFSHELFSAENGETSRELAAVIDPCLPPSDYKTYNLSEQRRYRSRDTDINPVGYRLLVGCIDGWSTEKQARAFTGAYREAILHRPKAYVAAVLNEASFFFYTPTSTAGAERLDTPSRCQIARVWFLYWYNDCIAQKPRLEQYPSLEYGEWLSRVFQPYLNLVDRREGSSSFLPYGAACLLMFGALFLMTRGVHRVIVGYSAVTAFYIALTIAAAQYTLIRYTAPLNPLYIVSAVILVLTVVRRVFCVVHANTRQIER